MIRENMLKLAADIGGTNTRLLLTDSPDTLVNKQPLAMQIYANDDYESFDGVLQQFLQEFSLPQVIDAMCLAIAGPIQSDTARLTNRNWQISKQELQAAYQCQQIHFINDFVALGQALEILQVEDVVALQHGHDFATITPLLPQYRSVALLGAGTGLGVAHWVHCGEEVHILSSESGHCSFAPEDSEQSVLLAWMRQHDPHVSIEYLLSGRGLVRLYEFFSDPRTPPDKHTKIPIASQITQRALSKQDLIAQKSLSCFVDIYASVCGNVALQYFPVDAVFIGGGIAPKILPFLQTEQFPRLFAAKGLMQAKLQNLPVYVITFDLAGLYGSLNYLYKQLQ